MNRSAVLETVTPFLPPALGRPALLRGDDWSIHTKIVQFQTAPDTYPLEATLSAG
jgi:hypothetical protein